MDADEAVQAYKDLARVERSLPLPEDGGSARSGRSGTGPPIAFAPTSFFACSPITSNGICAKPWRRCCSTTPISTSARAERSSPVAKTEPSETAKTKKAIKRNADGDRVSSFAGFIDHLATMTRNTMRMPLAAKHNFTLISKPTPLQDAAFRLLGLDPQRIQ